MKAVEDPSLWPKLSAESTLVERYTDRVLGILDEHRTKATFFILGWVAEKHPALIKRIADGGHEIATHSFWHKKVYEQTPESFKKDVADSIAAIRAAAGREVAVRGFRAPSFSIVPGTEWAFDVLLELGIRYDASLFPARRGQGGYAGRGAAGAHVLTTPAGRSLRELPMSIARVGVGPVKKRMCYSGGGYLRLLPISLIEQGLEQEAAAGRPTVIYLHPRDFAADCPRVRMPPHRRFKCYVGMKTTEPKLRALLARHRWDTCERVLEQALGADAAAVSGTGAA